MSALLKGDDLLHQAVYDAIFQQIARQLDIAEHEIAAMTEKHRVAAVTAAIALSQTGDPAQSTKLANLLLLNLLSGWQRGEVAIGSSDSCHKFMAAIVDALKAGLTAADDAVGEPDATGKSSQGYTPRTHTWAGTRSTLDEAQKGADATSKRNEII